MNQQAVADAQSVLTILVPEAERLVAPFREKYDPSAMTGMSAHITLIYPFLPPDEIDALVLGKIAKCSARFAAFDFSLAAIRRFDSGVVYLATRARRAVPPIDARNLERLAANPTVRRTVF